MQQIHRRKTSKDEDEPVVKLDNPSPQLAANTNGVTENLVNGNLSTPPLPRTRVASTPSQPVLGGSGSIHLPAAGSYPSQPPPTSPFRTSFSFGGTAQNGYHQVGLGAAPHSASPLRTSFSLPSQHTASHSRTRSVSGPYYTHSHSPPSPSPLHVSFPTTATSNSRISPSSSSPIRASSSSSSATSPIEPSLNGSPSPSSSAAAAVAAAKHNRRHSRLHSRNLSIFFPRPGSLPASAIAEDGVQEFDEEGRPFDEEAPEIDISSDVNGYNDVPPHLANGRTQVNGRQKLGEGFTFGGRPAPSDITTNGMVGSSPMSRDGTSRSRRGHHHRHSLSHNFFSFLEPGAAGSSRKVSGEEVGEGEDGHELHTTPALTPISPWNPNSPVTREGSSSTSGGGLSPDDEHHHHHGHSHSHSPSHTHSHSHSPVSPLVYPPLTHSAPSDTTLSWLLHPASLASFFQFILGACLWVSGQQVGSLACTGLGYWVVFDSFGIALSGVVSRWSDRGGLHGSIRRPYGNARMETVLLFAQSVYLMFSSVYVCKETVEHLLLSAGEEGHHHHFGDETMDVFGIQLPYLLILGSIVSLAASSVIFESHSKLVNISGSYLPPISSVIHSLTSRYPSSSYGVFHPPTTELGKILANPFTLAPIGFGVGLLAIVGLLPPSQHQGFDLFLAFAETVITFRFAYKACVALGSVLLQTAPERGLPGGRMEAFLRTMRDIERHPKILHLPPPHIWQLTAPLKHPMTRPSTYSLTSLSSSLSSPTSQSSLKERLRRGPAQSLVVTLELHVDKDLSDNEVLELTRWAWEKCIRALGGDVRGKGGSGRGEDGEAEAEVCVGIVRG
ncbi:hypothetical protein JAAARDRAFT_36096 [Jaapia argillacea MUCL 33604]|uniref:Uncharacterized protein n=1 Tax=Jaapia argillacea MUCL 33604 TaxID=933084 RepID=A0A067PZD1_9AGAM|nr:hypothetical protein JAAARDRAFT_36096 [Jaapia argillacea MUCL 33604]